MKTFEISPYFKSFELQAESWDDAVAMASGKLSDLSLSNFDFDVKEIDGSKKK